MATCKEKKEKSIRLDELPTWCGSDVIAAVLNKSVRRVQQLTQEGILHTEQMPNAGARKYRLTDSVRAYVDHLEEQARKRGDASERTRELEGRKLLAEVALKESQGELHRMKTAIAQGEYITVEEAQLDLIRFLSQFKKFAMSIPSRVGGIAAGYVEPVEARGLEKDLNKEITTILRRFADAAKVEDETGTAGQLTNCAPKGRKKVRGI